MPVEITENRNVNREEAGRIETRSPVEGVSIEEETKSAQTMPSSGSQPRRRRRLLIGVLGALLLAAIGISGIPWIRLALNTVSTDDAYVNGHVTFVAPRVSGQINRVLVDDNMRVKAGDLLVELDPEPYQVQVNIKQAALTAAEADRRATESDVRGTLAQ